MNNTIETITDIAALTVSPLVALSTIFMAASNPEIPVKDTMMVLGTAGLCGTFAIAAVGQKIENAVQAVRDLTGRATKRSPQRNGRRR